ncbi:hypothetical protein ACRAWF_05950 [Streptomyces sp. L7]
MLPPAVRELPFSWSAGFQWPAELPETADNIARAHEILRACAPTAPVPDPVPDPDWTGDEDEDEEEPDWLEIRSVLREFMPYADQVTEERMAEAMRECAARHPRCTRGRGRRGGGALRPAVGELDRRLDRRRGLDLARHVRGRRHPRDPVGDGTRRAVRPVRRRHRPGRVDAPLARHRPPKPRGPLPPGGGRHAVAVNEPQNRRG